MQFNSSWHAIYKSLNYIAENLYRRNFLGEFILIYFRGLTESIITNCVINFIAVVYVGFV